MSKEEEEEEEERQKQLKIQLEWERTAIELNNLEYCLLNGKLPYPSKPGEKRKLFSNEDFMFASFLKNLDALEYADVKLLGNEYFIFPAIMINVDAFKYATAELKGSKEFIFRVVSKKRKPFLKYMVHHLPELLDDEKFMLEVFSLDTEFWYYMSRKLRIKLLGDKQFMLSASLRIGFVDIRYATNKLRGDMDFMLKACKLRPEENFKALKYATKGLLGNKDFILNALAINVNALDYATLELLQDENFKLAVMSFDKTLSTKYDNLLTLASWDVAWNESCIENGIQYARRADMPKKGPCLLNAYAVDFRYTVAALDRHDTRRVLKSHFLVSTARRATKRKKII